MKTIIYSLLLLLFTTSIDAQQVVSGQVLDEAQTPISFVHVYWEGAEKGTYTDTMGYFHLNYMSNKRLVFSHIQFQPDTFALEEGLVVKRTLKLISSLKEAEVTAYRSGSEYMRSQTIQTMQINEKELNKAACCNLSESFETTPSIDQNFSDALLGYRQIQMLGLESKYMLITKNNMPFIRGLSSLYGLSLIPGTWVESMQLSKGIGSVVNGFESMSGQLNIELKHPASEAKQHYNVYANENGRMEANTFHRVVLNEKLSTSLLLHGSGRPWAMDLNSDGFMDGATGSQIHVNNGWNYETGKGTEAKLNIRYVKDSKLSGQMAEHHLGSGIYRAGVNVSQGEANLRVGHVFKSRPERSIGSQFFYTQTHQDSYFGNLNYQAQQKSAYGNVLFRDYIKTTDYLILSGISFINDQYDEHIGDTSFLRSETTTGLFTEFTWTLSDKTSLIPGIRLDYNNLYGWFSTPRIHVKHSLGEHTDFRASGGRGQRTANIFAENYPNFISSRKIQIIPNRISPAYGLSPEVSWNFGGSVLHSISLPKKEITLTLDAFYHYFKHLTLKDLERSAHEILFYSVSGAKTSSISGEVSSVFFKRLEVKVAYRWYHSEIPYLDGIRMLPLVASHRLFFNGNYQTKKNQQDMFWRMNVTSTWTGAKRIPNTTTLPIEYQLPISSPGFLTMNAQLSYVKEKKWEIYLGLENMTNFRQIEPIISPGEPFGDYFDASLTWGPIFGRMAYAGVRVDVF